MIFMNFCFTDTCYTGLVGIPSNTNGDCIMHSATVTDFICHIILTLTIKLLIFHIIKDKHIGRIKSLKYCKTMR